MGVMSCSRNTCDNIMCDTYVDGDVGYVCNECQQEFKEYLSKEGIRSKTEDEIHRALKAFMETIKDDYVQGNEMSVDEFFKSYTRD